VDSLLIFFKNIDILEDMAKAELWGGKLTKGLLAENGTF